MNTHGNPDNGKFEGIGRKPRGTLQRVVITGTLTLETPARFGSGDVEGLTDMPLLRDPVDNKPLLPGASIAGALRNYLREIEIGYGKDENPKAPKKSMAERLFGHLDDSISDKKASLQSWLLIDDAMGKTPGVEIRDGVALDPKTRTAAKGKKFDIELLEAGTTFDLSFELLLNEKDEGLQDALIYTLHGLEAGEIGMGQRKKRGLGRCKAGNWSVCTYDMSNPEQLIEWLEDDRSRALSGEKILELLQPKPEFMDRFKDQRKCFIIDAKFELESSLLVRSGSGKADSPGMVHLSSRRPGEPEPIPILSGTSLAGAVRARASRIAKTVVTDRADNLINGMFGQHIESRKDKPTGSRVVTRETLLTGTRDLVQSRVKLDRFTGGSYPGALFDQQPAFGGEGSRANVHLTIRNPEYAEIGLLLLVLKDLWTGDLPLGGESSVGRGRLRGLNADLTLRQNGQEKTWHITQTADGLDVTGSMDSPKEELEKFVKALHGKEN